jgi:hypothetical protein
VDNDARVTRLQSLRDLGDRVIRHTQHDYVTLAHTLKFIVMEDTNVVAHFT